MSEWQPMSTAPRDGTLILAYNPVAGLYTTAFTTRWTGEPGETGYEGFPCGFWQTGPGGYPFGKWDCVPCAWRPIDLPPPELRHHASPASPAGVSDEVPGKPENPALGASS